MRRLLLVLLLLFPAFVHSQENKWQITDANGKPLRAKIGGVVVTPVKQTEPLPAGETIKAVNVINATTDDLVVLDVVEQDGKTPVKGHIEWVLLPMGTKYNPYQDSAGVSHAAILPPPKGDKVTAIAFAGNEKGAIRAGVTEINYRVIPDGPPDVVVVDPVVPPVVPPVTPPVVEKPKWVGLVEPTMKADQLTGSTKKNMEDLAAAYSDLAKPLAAGVNDWATLGDFYAAMTTAYESKGFNATAPPMRATRSVLREQILKEVSGYGTALDNDKRSSLRKYCGQVADSIRFVAASLSDKVDPVVPPSDESLSAPYFVLIVSDQDNMTVETATIRTSPKIREFLDSKKLKSLFPDRRNMTSYPSIQSAIDSSGKSLPVIVVQGYAGGKLVNKVEPLPKTEDEVINIINKYVK